MVGLLQGGFGNVPGNLLCLEQLQHAPRGTMSFKGGASYQIEALAHKVYVEAAHERDYIAQFIAWAVIMYFAERG
jgi:hypothetical protein